MSRPQNININDEPQGFNDIPQAKIAPYDENANNNAEVVERTIPSKKDVAATFDINRCEQIPKNLYGQLRKSERTSLAAAVAQYAINKGLQEPVFPCFIPNAKLPWANRVLKDAMATGNISMCDYTLMISMWMNEAATSSLKSFLQLFKPLKNDKITSNYPTKGPRPSCAQGGLMYRLKNPGLYNLQTGQMEEYGSEDSMFDEIARYNHHLKSKNNSPDCKCKQVDTSAITDKILKLSTIKDNNCNNYALKKDILTNLSNLRNELNAKNISLERIQCLANDLNASSRRRENSYLMSLLYPAIRNSARIPSQMIGATTAVLSVRTNVQLTTNSSGNVAFAGASPILGAPGTAVSSFGINNDVSLTGTAFSNFFISAAIGQASTIDAYIAYRVVSMEIIATPVTSALTSSGFFTMGFNYDTLGAISGTGAIVTAAPYGVFSSIENCYGKVTLPLNGGKSGRVLFFPPDDRFNEFTTLGNGLPGWNVIGYVSGAPASTVVLRLDFVINYECTVRPQALDYIPTSNYQGDLSDLHETIKLLNNNSFMSKNADELRSAIGISPFENSSTIKEWIKPEYAKDDIKINLSTDKDKYDRLSDLLSVAETALDTDTASQVRNSTLNRLGL